MFSFAASFFDAQSNVAEVRELIQVPVGVFTGVVNTTRTVAATSDPVRLTDFGSTKTRLPLAVAPIGVHFFCA
jgi:hypothetical protein